MTDLRTAAQQALEALTAHADLHSTMYLKMDAITALRAALAEPADKPVAWMETENFVDGENLWDSRTTFNQQGNGTPLYTAPPQRKPLTDEEIINIGKEARAVEGPHILPVTFARAIERAHGIGDGIKTP